MNTFCLRRSACALGMALAVSVLAPASGRGQLRDQLQDLTILKQGLQTAPKVPDTRIPIPVDAPVNQEEYYVGPGDVFAVNVWSAPPIEHTLTVTPQGSLLIPSVGLIDVRDLTLRQVKEKVVQAAVKKYLKGEVSVTLLTPRMITVQIFGNIINEGTQEIYADERVDRLMAKSNVFPSERTTLEEYEAKVLLIRQTMSERRVVIRRSDGAVLPVDLARYRVTRDGRFNPYLRELVMVVNSNFSGGVSETAGFDRSINFARVADAMGCVGFRVERPDDIRPALDQAMAAGKPAIVEVLSDAAIRAKRGWSPGAGGAG